MGINIKLNELLTDGSADGYWLDIFVAKLVYPCIWTRLLCNGPNHDLCDAIFSELLPTFMCRWMLKTSFGCIGRQ
jgi:hypothetical protein